MRHAKFTWGYEICDCSCYVWHTSGSPLIYMATSIYLHASFLCMAAGVYLHAPFPTICIAYHPTSIYGSRYVPPCLICMAAGVYLHASFPITYMYGSRYTPPRLKCKWWFLLVECAFDPTPHVKEGGHSSCNGDGHSCWSHCVQGFHKLC